MITGVDSRLKALRRERRLKQGDVAKGIGVAPTTYASWEQGKAKPRGEKAEALAKFLGVSVGWLMFGEEAHSEHTLANAAAEYVRDIVLDDEPLTDQEQNELQMLRFLRQKNPELRQFASDKITEAFIRANME